jgi:hypothetical protein
MTKELLGLGVGDYRWPIGTPPAHAPRLQRFCAEPAVRGKPYCRECGKLAFPAWAAMAETERQAA